MIKNFEDFVNENQNIDESIDFEQLNESFTNQELKDAIKAHGGLSKGKFNSDYTRDARKGSTYFDLKNAKYVGYLKPETISDIIDSDCYKIIFRSLDILLYTKDGGMIVVDKGDSYLDNNYREWVKKIKNRDNNWIEDEVSEHPDEEFLNTGKRDEEYDYVTPNDDITSLRRWKHINNKKKK